MIAPKNTIFINRDPLSQQSWMILKGPCCSEYKRPWSFSWSPFGSFPCGYPLLVGDLRFANLYQGRGCSRPWSTLAHLRPLPWYICPPPWYICPSTLVLHLGRAPSTLVGSTLVYPEELYLGIGRPLYLGIGQSRGNPHWHVPRETSSTLEHPR